MRVSALLRLVCLGVSCHVPVALAADIVIGQCVPLSGSLVQTGEAMALGVRVAVEAENAAGGVNGTRLRLVQQDDGYETERTIQCTRDLIQKERAVALIGYAGTGNISELLKRQVLAESGVPLVAPYTGGMPLREPYNPYIFHIRASYADEIGAMVDQFTTTGLTRIAVFYQDDAFGQSGLAEVEKALASRQLQVVAKGAYQKNSEDVSAATNAIVAAQPQAVIMVGVTRPVGLFVKEVRTRLPGVQTFAISVVSGEDIYRIAGDAQGRGVGITEVMPSPFAGTQKIVAEYHTAMQRFAPGKPYSYASFEEYVGGRVLVAGLRKAGANPSPAAVGKALESVDLDLGGYRVAFGPQQRAGSRFVEVTLIGAGGRHVQ